jgi:uncharacterized protein (TIGR03067 family)
VLDVGLTGVGAGESVAADGDGLTGAGMVVGTPDYIAPEQISDPHAADARADIYGLGCTFYHLLTGRSPVPDGTIAQKLMAQESRTPDPIPDLPRGLADVLAKMLAKRPEDRYQSAEELLAALEPFLNAERKTRNAEPKTWGEKLTRWILAASLLFVGVAFIVKYYRDNEVITITTDDPDIEVVMKRKGEIVLIRDTKTGQTWEYDTIKDQFGLADQADGLKLGLPEKGEFVLWRKGERVFSVARTARPAAQSEASWVPLFNGKDLTNWAAVGAGTWTVEQGILRGTKDRLATTREYSHFDLRTEFKLHEKEPCVLQIGEGQQHLLVILTRTPRGLHAILTSGDPADKSSRTATGTIAAPAVDRFLTLRLLIDDQRVKLELDNEAVAELPRGAVPLTTGKILLSTGTEFRKIEIKELALTPVNSDKELILGSWRATSVEIDGVVMPQMVLDMMQPTLAFAPDKVTSKAEGPNAKGFLEFAKNMGLLTNEKDGAFVALNGGEGIYHLDPAKSPRTIDITTLGTVRKSALGLYSLDGDTLKLCLSIDPQKVSERPKEFSSRNGEKRVIVTLRRLAGAELPGSPRGMFALPTPAQGAAWALTLDGKGKFSIARDGKLSSEGTYKITGDQIEFTDEAGPFAETGDKRTGTYRWKLAGWAVLFTPVKDEARGRMSILVSGAWVKTPESVVTPPKP